MRKMGASNIDASKPCPKIAESQTRARRDRSDYMKYVSAEMATVLRSKATILIRLREKLRLHCLFVFAFVCSLLSLFVHLCHCLFTYAIVRSRLSNAKTFLKGKIREKAKIAWLTIPFCFGTVFRIMQSSKLWRTNDLQIKAKTKMSESG